MMLDLDCPHCGAAIRKQSDRICAYCGNELVREGTPRLPTRDEARVERFAQLDQHAELQRWLAHTPEVPPAVSGVALLVFLPLLAIFGLFALGTLLAIVESIVAGRMPFVSVVFSLFVVAGGTLIWPVIRRIRRYRSAPLLRRAAIVVGSRSQLSGNQINSGPSAALFASLEFPEGQRAQYRVDQRLAGQLTQGDAGVAYLKHETLIAFHRLRI